MQINKVLKRILKRDSALERLNQARIDVSGQTEAAVLGHRAVGFFGHLPARTCGRYRLPPCSLGVAGPKGRLP